MSGHDQIVANLSSVNGAVNHLMNSSKSLQRQFNEQKGKNFMAELKDM